MTPNLPNPFKPSKLNAISMAVSKVTSLLNHSLTVKQVKQLHALLLVNGLNHLEPVIITQIINIPSNHSRSTSNYLRSLLHHSKHPNVASRTSAIDFFIRHGEFQQVLAEYMNMQRSGLLPTITAVASALKACARLGDRVGGITIHGQVHGYGFCGDVHVGTALVGLYTKLDDMVTAKRVFDEMSERNAASWVINTYLESGNFTMAERLFSEMGNKDIASWNSMVSWYTKTRDMEKALASFGTMPVKNPASWITMINGYVDSGEIEIARNFYDVMPKQDVISCTKMIGGYSKCGDVESAREIFNEMGVKNHFLYNAMIVCYTQNGRPRDALQLFDEMLQPNVSIQPDNTTLANIISICSQLGDLSFGSWIEETLIKQMGIAINDDLGNALIELYAKYGRVNKAFELFHGLQKKDVGAYTALILACGRYGLKRDAIILFEEMLEANICPNLVTFSGVLIALNHVGMVQKSYHGFNSANPLVHPRPSNHSGLIEECYYGVNPSPLAHPRPLNHLDLIEESYHGVNPSPLAHPRLLNHLGRVEECCYGINPSPLAHPRPLHHWGRVEECYYGDNPSPLAHPRR